MQNLLQLKNLYLLKNSKPHKLTMRNVCSLLQLGKNTILEETLELINIYVAGVLALYFRNEDHYTTALGYFIYSSGSKDKIMNGVGF